MQLSIQQLKEILPDAHLDRRGKNLYAICPKCQHSEFGISLEDNHQFGCFRKNKCGFAGNVFTLLTFFGKSIRDLDPSFVPRQRIDIAQMLHTKGVELSLDLPDFKMPVGWKPIHDLPYLNERGFTEEDYKYYHPGVSEIDIRYKSDFVVFPIYQFGSIKGHIGRNLRSKKEIDSLNAVYKFRGSDKKVLRYRNSDSDFGKILLGVEDITLNTKTVIIVEGLFDKQNTDKVLKLKEQEEVKCCASFKCGMSDEQVMLLQRTNVDTIVLLYDPDVISEIKKTATDLDLYFETWVGINEKGNDPGSMSEFEFDTVLNNLKTASQFCRTVVDVPKLKRK